MTPDEATCCLLTATSLALVPTGRPLDHLYASANGTWPYCGHDAAVVRELDAQRYTDDGVPFEGLGSAMWVWQFEVTVLRQAPPQPSKPGECVDGLYGDCQTAAPFDLTLTGHHMGVSLDRRLLRRALIEQWCVCMRDSHNRSAHNHTRLVRTEAVAGGRFAGTRFIVEAALD